MDKGMTWSQETRNINNNTPSSQFRNTAVFDGGNKSPETRGGLLEGLAKIHNEVRHFNTYFILRDHVFMNIVGDHS